MQLHHKEKSKKKYKIVKSRKIWKETNPNTTKDKTDIGYIEIGISQTKDKQVQFHKIHAIWFEHSNAISW